MIFHANCLHWVIYRKCESMLSGKKKNISICSQPNVLHNMLSKIKNAESEHPGAVLVTVIILGPTVQSIVSLTSLLVFKKLTVLVSTISN